MKIGKNSLECEIAKDFFSKLIGLMFSKKKNILFVWEREGFYPIHSFFVFFKFHAVYINSKMEVVEIIRNVEPFTPYIVNTKPAQYLLEVSEDIDIEEGERLEI